MNANTILQVAQGRVKQYVDESVDLMQNHVEKMECRDCEDYLKHGIEAFKWLRRAEEMIREADAQGIEVLTPELREALDILYSSWLKPCERAQAWISSLETRGYIPDNLDNFKEACDEAVDIVERMDWQNKATRARIASSSSEEW